MYLLDTNTIIYYLKGGLPSNGMKVIGVIADDRPSISVITKIELLGFNAPNLEEQSLTNKFVEACFIFNLNEAVVNQTIVLRKQYKIKIPDAIIAATAMVFNLTLMTHNTNDFNKISNLQCIDPHLL
jgi:predicted nucleic acid-binding protein